MNEANTILLTQTETADFLRVSPRTLEKMRWTGCGGPPFVKIGRRCMYRKSDLMAYLDAQTRQSTSDPGPTSEAA